MCKSTVCIDESAIRPSRVIHSVTANRGTLPIRHIVPPLFRSGEIFLVRDSNLCLSPSESGASTLLNVPVGSIDPFARASANGRYCADLLPRDRREPDDTCHFRSIRLSRRKYTPLFAPPTPMRPPLDARISEVL
jgi:hypothetical protein